MTSMLDVLGAFSAFRRELELMAPCPKRRVFDRTFCPAVVKVVDDASEVTVHFEDGSKSVVKFSDFEGNSLENAVLYALVMRTFGLVDPETSEVVCPGLKKSLKRVIETRVVREKPETEEKKKKDPIPEMAAAEPFKNEEKEEKHGSQKTKKMSKIAEQLQKLGSSESWNSEGYVRPKKPFSQFSQEEKRAYWRWQNKKRRKTA